MGLSVNIWKNIAVPIGQKFSSRPKREISLFCFLLTTLIGLADYASGTEILFSVVYAVPISIAAWFVGSGSALALGGLSIVLWQAGDIAGHIHYSDSLVPVWNAALRLIFYSFLILVLVRLNHLQRNLESLANERANALAAEITERESLEREMLGISEREQRRIGQDLHDGLCQQLTATALEGQLIAERLYEKNNVSDANDVLKTVAHIQEAVSLARGIAKGLYPIEMQAEGLMDALEEFTSRTSELFGVGCRFECNVPVLIHNPSIATHLYRIAQEAVGNALKHGRANDIAVSLDESTNGIELHIVDNGSGLDMSRLNHDGIGIRIMEDRTKMMGGTFSLFPTKVGGVEVCCIVPQAESS